MDIHTIYAVIGFTLAAYAVIGNDSVQTLGTFITSLTRRHYKMSVARKFLLTTCLVTAFTMPAHADDRDARIAAMEQQMQMLMQELQTMKAERAVEKQEHAALKQQVNVLETKNANVLAGVSPASGDDDGVQITMSPSPKITKGDFSWQPFGRIQLDAGAFDDDRVDHPDGAEFRRARLGMKGNVSKNFGYKAEVDFANEGVSLKDMYINYTGLEDSEIRVGHFKPGFGMEELTSANDLTFLERSGVTSSFATGEQLGAGVLTHGEQWSAAFGLFNDDAGVQSTDDEAWSVTGRVAGAPVMNDDYVLHLGASASYRNPDQANNTFDLDARAENALQTVDSVSSVITDAKNALFYGLEAAGAWGPFSLQGEYMFVDIENVAGNDPSFDGGYAQASWFLTGENRPYKAATGVFGRPKPNNDFDPQNGGWGAFELAARYSHLNLNDGTVRGGEMDNITFATNWYLNKNVRLMGNYIMVDTDNDAVTADDDPHIFLVRSQLDF